MKTTQSKIEEILGVLKSAKYDLTNQDEFGFELTAADGSHKCFLQQTTATFSHPSNKEITYSVGANVQDIKAFLKADHSFDEATYKKEEPAAEGEVKPKKEKKAPVVKAVKEKAVKVPKEKKAKVVVEKEEKGPSIRQEVLKMIEATGGTVSAEDRAKILAHLATTFPEREEADLKNKISLYKGYFEKGQRSKEYVTPVVVATPAAESAPAEEPATTTETPAA